jgi:P27 family predicted phage terminase small subunit
MPTHLKIIRGKRSKKPPNPREPMPVGDLTDPPEHFDGDLREVWKYAIDNAPRGLLKRIDSAVLETWCSAHVLHRQALAEVRKVGLLVKAPNTGLPIQSPFLPIVNKQALIMMRAVDHLGFSPASRTRIIMGDTPLHAAGGWDDVEGAG